MENIYLNKSIANIFVRNRKCIVNADLDGVLSGMLLQRFLGWEIVGYSSCCGKYNDELWLKEGTENLRECVFVDLPVCLADFSVIDQHFVAFDTDCLQRYEENSNKINPNIMRRLVFKNGGVNQYTDKYPFGTVHFILAVMENLKIIPEAFRFDFFKKIDNFDFADLFLRADRVVGNTCSYTKNCFSWINWLCEIGGVNTKTLFEEVVTKLYLRKISEKKVESKLASLGCIGLDGDCSNLLRSGDYNRLNDYFNFLSASSGLQAAPVFTFYNFGKLKGEHYAVTYNNLANLKATCRAANVFSYAFVSKSVLSLTRLV